MNKKNKDEIRVLHVISSAEIAGGERYLYDLIKHSDNKFKHMVLLPYHGPFEMLLKKSDFKYTTIKLQKKFSIRSLFRIIKLIVF